MGNEYSTTNLPTKLFFLTPYYPHLFTAVNDIDFRFGGGLLYGSVVLYGET